MKIEIEIPDKRVADLLCWAWEGGSNYWARADGQPYDLDGKLTLGTDVQKGPLYVYDDGSLGPHVAVSRAQPTTGGVVS